MGKLFPIGTIVKVGLGNDLLMIINRYPLTIQNGVKGYYDYSACIYPIGVNTNNEQYFFNHEDIVEVIFEGYVNQMEEKLQEYYHEKAPSITYPKFSIYD